MATCVDAPGCWPGVPLLVERNLGIDLQELGERRHRRREMSGCSRVVMSDDIPVPQVSEDLA